MTPPITALGSRYGIQGALGRSVKRAAAGGGWWDLNGTITSCVAAYQPKGAASYADSLINLASPGTNNAVEGVAPQWDSTNGWKGTGSSYLYVPVTPLSSWTIAITFTNRGVRYEYYYAAGNISLLHTNVPNLRAYWGNTSGLSYFGGSSTNGTLIHTVISGKRYCRLNDVPPSIDGDLTKYWNGTGNLFILSKDSTSSFAQIYIQAFSVYNTSFTTEQVSALTTAMNAL